MDDARIEQFKKMAADDPDNELGHFSLGRTYLEASRPAEAVPCLERVIEINPQNSKAYFMLAQAQKAAGDPGGAISALRIGFDVATARGDVMVRNDIAALMTEVGEPVPDVPDASASAPATPVGEGEVLCRRCGQTRSQLAKRPFKGELGEKILAHVCASCWQEWLHMGTKVINELRLDFADPRHAAVYDQHLAEFLSLE